MDASPGFNEARADSPGRLATGVPSEYRAVEASMRPGPIRPGDLRSSGPRGASRPRFNEARADSPGRYCSTRSRVSPRLSSLQ